ncbi:OPT family oligopeptide transporter [candidate division KSB1 bacterium]|nr:MAG: OPT family oligopeptide transporter [candidate division KSB1 bacterium]
MAVVQDPVKMKMPGEKTASELTLRAVLAGLVVGSLIGASNVCIGLKIGWTFGASITAAVISFALFRGMASMLSRPYGAKENLITATAGSAAGTMASAGGFVACIPALELYRQQTMGPGHNLSYPQLCIWAISIAFLGVFFAIPLRKQMVVREKLRYPTGTAAAETIKAMYSSGIEAVKKARVLLFSALFAAAFKLIFSIKPIGLSGLMDFSLDDVGLATVGILGVTLASVKMGIGLSPMMLGAGILVGPKVGWSLFAGAILSWGIGAPILYDLNVVTGPHTGVYSTAFRWLLWPGVACMVAAGFASLGLQYKVIGHTFSSFMKLVKGQKSAQQVDEDDAPDPFPIKWWAVGMVAATALTTTLAHIYFDIAIWMGILAVVLSFLIASIAVRATGETDINPIGAMGKITQVVYGALDPGRIPTNLMAAGITAAGASQSGDLMHDLKAGYLLKVSIRKQVIAQLCGVIVGVFTAAAVYRLLTAAYPIPGDDFAGPAVMAWHAMAELLAKGIKSLPPHAMTAASVGAVVGLAIPIIASINKKIGKWLPSPIALGIAFMVTPYSSLSMWAGALLTYLYNRKHADRVDRFGASLASGLIAGEGLMMVVIAILLILGVKWV